MKIVGAVGAVAVAGAVVIIASGHQVVADTPEAGGQWGLAGCRRNECGADMPGRRVPDNAPTWGIPKSCFFSSLILYQQ